jgi:hypothetical protein
MRYSRCKPVAEVGKTALERQLEPVAPIAIENREQPRIWAKDREDAETRGRLFACVRVCSWHSGPQRDRSGIRNGPQMDRSFVDVRVEKLAEIPMKYRSASGKRRLRPRYERHAALLQSDAS